MTDTRAPLTLPNGSAPAPRHASLFTGIGGFELAAEHAGMMNVAMCENDTAAMHVLAHRWPDVPCWNDVAHLDGTTIQADVLTAGSPCQDFSIAGMRKGLAGSRSGLFEHVVRLRDEIRPRFVVWENVPGALTSNKGADFANVVGALVGSDEPLPLPKHPNGRRSRYAGVAHGPAGTLAWRVLDAQHFGVPQRRQRIFAVLDTQGWEAPSVLFPGYEPVPVPWVMRGTSWAQPLDVDGLPFGTGMAAGTHGRVRLADVLEPDVDDRFYLSVTACRGILERAGRRGRALPDVLDYALRVQAGEVVGEPPVVAVGASGIVQRGEGHTWLEEGSHAPLTSGGGLPGQSYACALVPVLMKQREGKPGGGKGPLLSTDLSLTLATGNDQTLFEPQTYQKIVRSGARDTDGNLPPEVWAARDVSSTLNLFDQGDKRAVDIVVEPPAYRVRRLTPTECERLQGFPDGHTIVPNGRDSHRYRQLGNAVAVPVAEWVLGRVAEAMRSTCNDDARSMCP